MSLNRRKLIANVLSAPLDWSIHGADGFSNTVDVKNDIVYSRQWDLIIGSDLVYNPAGVNLLPRVIASLVCVAL